MVVRNKSKPESRAFWDSVEKCSEKVREMDARKKKCPVVRKAIEHGRRSDE